MSSTRDPFARDRRFNISRQDPRQPPLEVVDERRLKVWRLRTDERLTPKEIARKLGISVQTVHNDLQDKHGKLIASYSSYGQRLREENEAELEAFKAHLAAYIYDRDVVIRGEGKGQDGKPRVVELSKFEAMLKVAPLYLAAINTQNKMWGLYLTPEQKKGGTSQTLNVQTLSLQMVQDLQRIARNEPLTSPREGPLPEDNGARP